jgi:hypothetical protein
MTRIVRWRPSPALVIACIALLLALGGVSYGLATGAIDSREIKNNTIRSRDVRIGALRGRDIRRGTIAGREVRESRLGTVPARLRSTATISRGSTGASRRGRPPGQSSRSAADHQRHLHGGRRPQPQRDHCGEQLDRAHRQRPRRWGHPASYADHNDLDIGENVNALPGGDTRAKGSLTYVSPSGSVVDASYLAEEQANGLVSVNDCFVVGKVTQSG